MAKASDNPFPSLLLVEQAAAPATPAAGQARLYRGTDNKLYIVDDAGVATEVGAGGGGGSADGAWTAYTPTLTNGTVGNGTLTGKYKLLGNKTLAWRVNWTLGSTSAITGVLFVGLPSGCVVADVSTGVWEGTNNSLNFGGATITDASSPTKIAGIVGTGGDTYINTGSPFVWGSGHKLVMSGLYEIL